MGKEEGKHPDEQQRHQDKGVVNQGILVPIVFLRVCIELGKACGGGRVTFLACCEDVLLGQLGSGILNLLDRMMPVAV